MYCSFQMHYQEPVDPGKGKVVFFNSIHFMKTKLNQNLRALRAVLGQTQAEFAATIGVSRDAVASWDCGRNPLSPGLARRIALATGVDERALLREGLPLQTLALPRRPYTRAEFEAHQKHFWGGHTEASARRHAQRCQEALELLFVAAARQEQPGRVSGVLASFIEWCQETRTHFGLEQAIDAQLEQRPKALVLTKTYGQWRELAKTGPSMARTMGFKDDPKRADRETLTLSADLVPVWQPGQAMGGKPISKTQR